MTRVAAGKAGAIGVEPAPGDAFSELIAASRAPKQRSDFGGPVQRPLYSVLGSTAVPPLRHWRAGLERYMAEKHGLSA